MSPTLIPLPITRGRETSPRSRAKTPFDPRLRQSGSALFAEGLTAGQADDDGRQETNRRVAQPPALGSDSAVFRWPTPSVRRNIAAERGL